MKLSAPIHILKSQAKALKRSQGLQLSEALNVIARREGYASWSLLQAKSSEVLPNRREDVLDYCQNGDLILIGARPGTGKTTFAVSMLVQALQQRPIKHWFFTLSEIHRDVAQRIGRYDENIGNLDGRLVLDYSDDIDANYVIEKTKHDISEGSTVFVECLQCLDQRRSSPELQDQMSALKAYAKENRCLIVLLSQLSRTVEAKPDRRPSLADVKLINPLDLGLFQQNSSAPQRSKESNPSRNHLRPSHHTLSENALGRRKIALLLNTKRHHFRFFVLARKATTEHRSWSRSGELA